MSTPISNQYVHDLDRQHVFHSWSTQGALNPLVIAGGVSANQALRQSLEKMLAELKGGVFYARPAFCTDNGAMIAYAGCQRLLAGQHEDLSIKVQARWPMEQLPAL